MSLPRAKRLCLLAVIGFVWAAGCTEPAEDASVATGVCVESSAQTWVQARNSRSQVDVAWAGDDCQRIYLDHRVHKGLEPGAFATAIDAAFASWSDIGCTRFCAAVVGPTDSDVRPPVAGYDADAPDSNENVAFAEPSSEAWLAQFGQIALSATLVTSDVTSGEILDADIVLNLGSYRFVDAGEDGLGATCADDSVADLRNVLTHEVGHFLGLDHTSNMATTMYGAWLEPVDGRCEVTKRRLSVGDVAGVRALYPQSGPCPCPE